MEDLFVDDLITAGDKITDVQTLKDSYINMQRNRVCHAQVALKFP